MDELARQGDLTGIVHLGALDMQADALAELPMLRQDHSSLAALALMQGILRVPFTKVPRLWLISSGAFSIGPSTSPNVTQAPLWGLGRVIATECKQFWGGLVDLEPGLPPTMCDLLVRELLGPDGEDQILLRGGDRSVLRLVRRSIPSAAPLRVSEDETVLITGGLGGLGVSLASDLVRRGARHVALLGRSEPSPPARVILDQLRAAGTNVVTFAADVTSYAQLVKVFDTLAATMPPLQHVFHAAGVVDDAVIANQTRERFAAVVAPKLAGAWNLHLLTHGLRLKTFVLFSSISALTGAPAQANYAAANAFLDALAHMRRSQGAAALSVNWGPWDEVGMAASLGDEGRRRRASYGMGVLARDEAFSALSDLLADGSAQAAVVRVEWKGYSAATQGPRLLSAIVPGPVAAPDASLRAPLLAQLQSGTPRQRETLITTFVREGIRRVIGHPLSATINPNQPLSELGLNSLMAVELRNVLGEGLGRSLPVTLMFDYPTLQDLE